MSNLIQQIDDLAAKGDHQGILSLVEASDLKTLGASDRSWACHAAAHAHINAGTGDQADAWFEKITQIIGADPVCLAEAHCSAGYSHAAKGERLHAKHAFEKAIDIGGAAMPCHIASAHFHLAKVHIDDEAFDLARTAIENALAIPEIYNDEKKEAERILKQLP